MSVIDERFTGKVDYHDKDDLKEHIRILEQQVAEKKRQREEERRKEKEEILKTYENGIVVGEKEKNMRRRSRPALGAPIADQSGFGFHNVGGGNEEVMTERERRFNQRLQERQHAQDTSIHLGVEPGTRSDKNSLFGNSNPEVLVSPKKSFQPPTPKERFQAQEKSNLSKRDEIYRKKREKFLKQQGGHSNQHIEDRSRPIRHSSPQPEQDLEMQIFKQPPRPIEPKSPIMEQVNQLPQTQTPRRSSVNQLSNQQDANLSKNSNRGSQDVFGNLGQYQENRGMKKPFSHDIPQSPHKIQKSQVSRNSEQTYDQPGIFDKLGQYQEQKKVKNNFKHDIPLPSPENKPIYRNSTRKRDENSAETGLFDKIGAYEDMRKTKKPFKHDIPPTMNVVQKRNFIASNDNLVDEQDNLFSKIGEKRQRNRFDHVIPKDTQSFKVDKKSHLIEQNIAEESFFSKLGQDNAQHRYMARRQQAENFHAPYPTNDLPLQQMRNDGNFSQPGNYGHVDGRDKKEEYRIFLQRQMEEKRKRELEEEQKKEVIQESITVASMEKQPNDPNADVARRSNFKYGEPAIRQEKERKLKQQQLLREELNRQVEEAKKRKEEEERKIREEEEREQRRYEKYLKEEKEKKKREKEAMRERALEEERKLAMIRDQHVKEKGRKFQPHPDFQTAANPNSISNDQQVDGSTKIRFDEIPVGPSKNVPYDEIPVGRSANKSFQSEKSEKQQELEFIEQQKREKRIQKEKYQKEIAESQLKEVQMEREKEFQRQERIRKRHEDEQKEKEIEQEKKRMLREEQIRVQKLTDELLRKDEEMRKQKEYYEEKLRQEELRRARTPTREIESSSRMIDQSEIESDEELDELPAESRDIFNPQQSIRASQFFTQSIDGTTKFLYPDEDPFSVDDDYSPSKDDLQSLRPVSSMSMMSDMSTESAITTYSTIAKDLKTKLNHLKQIDSASPGNDRRKAIRQYLQTRPVYDPNRYSIARSPTPSETSSLPNQSSRLVYEDEISSVGLPSILPDPFENDEEEYFLKKRRPRPKVDQSLAGRSAFIYSKDF